MKPYTLEVCADSVESVLAAQSGGATRIELCGHLSIGGTTPSPALFRQVQRQCSLPLMVMIRPRFGDFCYTDQEFAIMQEEVALFRSLGAHGLVFGILRPDGTLDTGRMAALMQVAGQLPVTLHRAFDLCRDPFATLEEAVTLGIRTILTSGQAATCREGAHLLTQLQQRAAGRISILAGAGVNAEVIRQLWQGTGLTAWHMSGKVNLQSPMVYRKEGVPMGLPGLDEFTLSRTDAKKVRAARQVLEQLTQKGEIL